MHKIFLCTSKQFFVRIFGVRKAEAVHSQLHTTGKRTTTLAKVNVVWLTGIESHVLLMSCSLPDDWSYNKVMLQLVGTAGTVIVQEHFF